VAAGDGRAGLPAADVEPGAGDEREGACPIEAFDEAVDLRIVSYRRRLADTDGLCAKWVIDAIVAGGLLEDDRQDCIERIEWVQRRADGAGD